MPLHEIAVVCPSVDALRVPIETAFAALGVPLCDRGPLRRSGRRRSAGSLLSLLRFAWLGGERPELYAHLRSPYSGLARRDVDWVEGKLRGRGVVRGDRAVEVTGEVRGGRGLPTLDLVARAPRRPLELVRDASALMLRNAHGTVEPDLGASLARRPARARRDRPDAGRARTAGGATGVDIGRGDVLGGARAHAPCAVTAPRRPGRVAVLDLARARTRRFEVVFVVGLEQGALPRRARPSAFLGDDERRSARRSAAARASSGPTRSSRDRYLFLTACTRPTRRLVLVRQAAGEEGAPA